MDSLILDAEFDWKNYIFRLQDSHHKTKIGKNYVNDLQIPFQVSI